MGYYTAFDLHIDQQNDEEIITELIKKRVEEVAKDPFKKILDPEILINEKLRFRLILRKAVTRLYFNIINQVEEKSVKIVLRVPNNMPALQIPVY